MTVFASEFKEAEEAMDWSLYLFILSILNQETESENLETDSHHSGTCLYKRLSSAGNRHVKKYEQN